MTKIGQLFQSLMAGGLRLFAQGARLRTNCSKPLPKPRLGGAPDDPQNRPESRPILPSTGRRFARSRHSLPARAGDPGAPGRGLFATKKSRKKMGISFNTVREYGPQRLPQTARHFPDRSRRQIPAQRHRKSLRASALIRSPTLVGLCGPLETLANL